MGTIVTKINGIKGFYKEIAKFNKKILKNKGTLLMSQRNLLKIKGKAARIKETPMFLKLSLILTKRRRTVKI